MKNTLWSNLLVVLFVGFVISSIFGSAQKASLEAQKAALTGSQGSSLLEY